MFFKLHSKSCRLRQFVLIPIIVLSTVLHSNAQVDNGTGCIGNVNLSLPPSTCMDTIAVNQVLEPNSYFPKSFDYSLTIFDEYGNVVDNNFGIDDVWKTYKVSVTGSGIIATTGSGIMVSCWGNVTIDKAGAPTIQCPTDPIMVSCLLDPSNYPTPGITTSCGITSDVVQVGQDQIVNICDDTKPDVVAEVTRSYRAISALGAASNVCTATYIVKKFDITNVTFPTEGVVGTCNDGDIITDPSLLGYPFIRTLSGSGTFVATGSGIGSPGVDTTFIFPTPNSFCNILVSLDNDTLSQDECETKVLRTWTVQQWLCDNTEEIRSAKQVITLRDTEGPAITCPTEPITALASGTTCKAFVNMPTLNIDDSCSEVASVSMDYLPEGILNSNGGTISLPVGVHIVKYIATDECNGESICEVTVNVSGSAPPVVICEQHVAISLTNSGTAHVPASVFDDGSYGCGFSHVLAAKMIDICGDTIVPDPPFMDHVKFCCDEAVDPPMVRLRAYNYDGSFNECMTEITIADKNPVSLVCPSNITVSCDFVYDMDDLSIFGTVATVPTDRGNIVIDAKTVMFEDGIGRDGLATGGCEMAVNEGVTTDQSTISCGTGSIKRTFTLSNVNDTKQCEQLIIIEGGSDFDPNSIVFPKDTTIDIACGVALTTTDVTGKPTFMEADCQQLGASFTDETFSTADSNDDDTCRKIFRYWTVIDWCNTDPDTGQPKRYPETGGGELQVIKIVKTVKPVVNCTNATLFESVEASCLVSDVSLTASVTGCPNTSEYRYEYLLDFNCDGTVDSVGTTSAFNGQLLAGDHCITWTVTDLCGNISDPCRHDFQVRNNKGPSAVCIANLTVTLDSMDASGNGQLDTVMQMLWAKDIDSGSSQSCGNPISFSFSKDSIVDMITFNCDDANARRMVGFYVFDDKTGNVAECWTEVSVQDPLNRCSGMLQQNLARVSGLLTTESGDKISEVEMSLLGSELSDLMTDQEGLYAFSSMPMGGNYTVTASKDKDHINGVSTLDLVLIQKHILGLDILNSPYKMIAADINKSNSVTASDIVELRKVILGEQDQFSSNTSWRFIDKEYVFPNTSNPWHEIFPEEYDIIGLDNNMSVDFLGVKVGDVSGNASANATSMAEVRSTNNPLRFISEVEKGAGDLVAIKVSSSNFNAVNGFQTTFSFDASSLEFVDVKSNNLEISMSNVGTYAVHRGLLTMSWSDADDISLDNTSEVFTLVFRSKGESVPAVTIGSQLLATEAYFDGNISNSITMNTIENEGLLLSQNVPNPWKDHTTISFEIPEAGDVSMRVLDMSGKILMTQKTSYATGKNQVTIDRSLIPHAGVYMVELRYKTESQIKRMIVLD